MISSKYDKARSNSAAKSFESRMSLNFNDITSFLRSLSFDQKETVRVFNNLHDSFYNFPRESGSGGVVVEGSVRYSNELVEAFNSSNVGQRPISIGLEGRNIYIYTAKNDTIYGDPNFDSLDPIFFKRNNLNGKTRPNTIYETVVALKTYTDGELNNLLSIINNLEEGESISDYTKNYIGRIAFSSTEDSKGNVNSIVDKVNKALYRIDQLAADTYTSGYSFGDHRSGTAASITEPCTLESRIDALMALHGADACGTGLSHSSEDGFTLSNNLLINGDFQIFQRGFSGISSGTTEFFVADRWAASGAGNSLTVTRESQLPGSAFTTNVRPYYIRLTEATGTSGSPYFSQKIENIYKLSGKLVNWIFIARSSTESLIQPYIQQYFGSGGSTPVVEELSPIELTTSWRMYVVSGETSRNLLVPSISGKTVDVDSRNTYTEFLFSLPNDEEAYTIDFALVAVMEYNGKNYDTGINPSTGNFPVLRTIQEELDLCQRYYEKSFIYDMAPDTEVGLGTGCIIEPLGVYSGESAKQIFFKKEKRNNTYAVTTYNPLADNSGWGNIDTDGTSLAGVVIQTNLDMLITRADVWDAESNSLVCIHWSVDSEF